MFDKLKNFLKATDTGNVSKGNKKWQLLMPNYDQRINYNPELDDNPNVTFKKLDSYINKGDMQLELFKKADEHIKNGKVEQGLKIYNRIILEDGLCINCQSCVMDYLNHLYKLKKYDEAWGVLNQYILKYPSLEKKYQDFRVKILKKEKRFNDALYHQVLAILFDNIHYRTIPHDIYEKKYMMLLKKLKLEDKALEVQDLINNYTSWRRYEQREIRDDLWAIIEG